MSRQWVTHAKQPGVHETRIPGRHQVESDEHDRCDGCARDAMPPVDANREQAGSGNQSRNGEAKDLMKIEPKEQHVAAEQGTEQRANGIPAIEVAGEVAEVIHFSPHVMKKQGESGTRKKHRETDRHEDEREAHGVIKPKRSITTANQRAQGLNRVRRFVDLGVEHPEDQTD